MTVDKELIKIGQSRFFNQGAEIILPEYVMPSEINTLIPSETALVTEDDSQQYPIGTQLKKNGRIFRYCKAGAAMTDRGFLKGNYYQCPGKAGNSATSGFEGAPYAAVAAGDLSFSIADTAATKNLYEGAYVVVYDDTNTCYQTLRIIGNDVSDGTSTKLYVASPGVKNAWTTSFGITVYLNPYMNVRSMATVGSYGSALGYATFNITSAHFFWLQTAGVISGVTGASTWPGQTAYQRDCFCNTDGSLIGITSVTYLYQRVGFLISRTASDYGDNFIMLQLDQ